MRTETQVNELFIHLNPLTSFIDYGLIEYFVKKFGSDTLKRDMQLYCSEISKFMKETTIKQLIDHFPGQPEIPPKFSLIEAKIGQNAIDCTLDQLNTIRKRYCSEVKLSEIVFHLVAVVESNSFIVRWLVPSTLLYDIMKSARNVDQSFYQEYKITFLTLDGMWLYVDEAEIDAMWSRVCVSDSKFKDLLYTIYKQIRYELEMGKISKEMLFSYLMDQCTELGNYERALLNVSEALLKHNLPFPFINFRILIIIIERFCSDCLKKVVKSYYISIYQEQSTAQHLSPNQFEPSKYFVTAECRNNVKESSVVESNSSIIGWLIPSALVFNVMKYTGDVDQSLHLEYKITSLTLDGMWLFLSEVEIDAMWSWLHVSDKQFQDQFHTMYKQILLELEVQGVSEHELSLHFKESFKCQQYICDHLSLALLKRELPASFLDFKVLTTVIERFGSNCLKSVLRSYCKYMSIFIKQSTAQQLINLPAIQRRPEKYSIAKCIIMKEPSHYTVEKLLEFRSTINNFSEVCFAIDEVNAKISGSFTVSWLVPSDLILDTMKSVRNVMQSFYQRWAISSLTLDGMWLFVSEDEIDSMWTQVYVSGTKFKNQFHAMYKQIVYELEIGVISECELSSYFMNQRPKLQSKETIQLCEAILNHDFPLSVFDFRVLTIVIESFGSDCLKRVMKSYCSFIMSIITGQSTAEQLIDLSPVHFEPSKCFVTTECRIIKEPSDYGLEKLLNFQTWFCTTVNIDEICFIVCEIKTEISGSFIVSWLILSSIAFDLLESANQIKETEIFQEFNIASLHIGNGWLYHHHLTPFGSILKKRYQQSQGSPSPVEWIPSPTKKIFRLAMIQRERVQQGHIEDRFVQMTISGRIDDILHAKSPVELEDIFRDTLYESEIILIEGAPGSGKSTLAVHICQRWGKGELFQQFTVVILVQLRDPAVQRAQTIADLLPVENAQQLAPKLIATNGRGVLWVLDGWDELPPHLQQDSIFRKLLPPKPSEEKLKEIKEDPLYARCVRRKYSKEELWSVYIQNNQFSKEYYNKRLLNKCSVIVTSRSISSGDLHPVVSSRIEVLGFTPEEQRQYFTECLQGDTKALEALLKKIQENPVVQSICYLPLNAAFIVHTFKYKGESLPNTEYEIYLSVILSCIRRHIEREGRGHDLPRELASLDDLSRSIAVGEPFQRVCELAYHGVMENKVTFSSSDLPQGSNTLSVLQAIESFLQSGKSVFYNFLHLSIQEVLSAYYISMWLSDSEQVSQFQQLFNQPRFASVFQFYAAITKLKCPGIRQVLARIVGAKSKSLLVSLLRCLHETQDPSLCRYVAEQLDLDVIAKMQYIRLDLSGNSLSPLNCLSLSFFLSSANIAIKADFSNCSIGDLGAKCLAKYLDGSVDHVSKVALILVVNDNDIHEEGASHIARIVNFIEHLYLSCNPIGDTGASLISDAVRETATLKTLSLNFCSITSGGADDLSRALSQNSSLKKLDIGSNNLGDEGISHMAEALKENKQLKELWIGKCEVTDEGAASLASALSVNNSLKMLHIGGHRGGLTENGLSAITQSLANNSKFVKLAIPGDFRSIGSHRYSFVSVAHLLSRKVNEPRKRNGLPSIEVEGEYRMGCIAYLFL